VSVVWLVWDAAAAWAVDRLEAEGALPALTRLRAAGVYGRCRPPGPNCQTPAGLATLFTGTRSTEHGITGFDLPARDGEAVDRQHPGFGPGLLRRPTVWQRLLVSGGSFASVHAPWVLTPDEPPGPGVVAAVEAYSTRLDRAQVLPLPRHGELHWPVAGEPVTVVVTPDGVRLTTAAEQVTVGPNWVPVRLPGGSGFWVALVRLADRRPALVRTSSWVRRAAGSDAGLVGRFLDGPVFAGEGVKRLYRAGTFGPRLVDGGRGQAEEVFVGSLAAVASSFADAAGAVLAGPLPDLTVIYLPYTDDAGHELLGWCDTRSAAYRPDVAGQIWTWLRLIYGWADEVLAAVLERTGPQDTVVLSADHGIVGSAWQVYPNRVLADAGLLHHNDSGGIDAGRSTAVYSPANNGTLLVNHEGRPGGRVPREHCGQAMAAAMTALLARPLPEGVAGPAVVGFVDAEGRPLRPDVLPADADIAYLVLSDDYQPSGSVSEGEWLQPMTKSGAHVVNTADPRLHATVAARGPGLATGGELGVLNNTVSAQWVSAALRLPTPAAADTIPLISGRIR
jgi:hypothetical protein